MESLLQRSYKHRYKSHIAMFFSTATIVSTQNDIFIVAGFWSTAISNLPMLKLYIAAVLCPAVVGCRKRLYLQRRYQKMPQQTLCIAAIPKKAQYATYSDSFCTRCKKTAAIVQISCSNRSNSTSDQICDICNNHKFDWHKEPRSKFQDLEWREKKGNTRKSRTQMIKVVGKKRTRFVL